jgi:hypothetical protein
MKITKSIFKRFMAALTLIMGASLLLNPYLIIRFPHVFGIIALIVGYFVITGED